MSRIRRCGLWLAIGSAIATGPAPARAEAGLPELAARNFFAATGSAQGTFTLVADAVLETYSEWAFEPQDAWLNDDTRLRTDGDWAGLVIQRVSPERTVTVSFASIKGHCSVLDPTCESIADCDLEPICQPSEKDDGRGSELAPEQTDSRWAPRYLLRAGTYVVAILGQPGARTTAALSLTGLEPSSASEHAVEYAQRKAGALLEPHHELADPTAASMQVSHFMSLWPDPFVGAIEGEAQTDSRVFDGLQYDGWMSLKDPTVTRIKDCFEWADLAEKVCWTYTRSFTSCSVCGGLPVGPGPEDGTYAGIDIPPGRFRWTWQIDSDGVDLRGSAYLIAWPYA